MGEKEPWQPGSLSRILEATSPSAVSSVIEEKGRQARPGAGFRAPRGCWAVADSPCQRLGYLKYHRCPWHPVP